MERLLLGETAGKSSIAASVAGCSCAAKQPSIRANKRAMEGT
jgi:hypothetical protein